MTEHILHNLYHQIQHVRQTTWIYPDEPTRILVEDHLRRAETMAPNLAPSALKFIHDMILRNELTRAQIANVACCHRYYH